MSDLTFRSLIHFEFIFVYGVMEWSNFILLHVAVQFSQPHLLKRLSFLHCICFPPLSKIRWPYVCGFISGLSIQFYWCIFLFYNKMNLKESDTCFDLELKKVSKYNNTSQYIWHIFKTWFTYNIMFSWNKIFYSGGCFIAFYPPYLNALWFKKRKKFFFFFFFTVI